MPVARYGDSTIRYLSLTKTPLIIIIEAFALREGLALLRFERGRSVRFTMGDVAPLVADFPTSTQRTFMVS